MNKMNVKVNKRLLADSVDRVRPGGEVYDKFFEPFIKIMRHTARANGLDLFEKPSQRIAEDVIENEYLDFLYLLKKDIDKTTKKFLGRNTKVNVLYDLIYSTSIIRSSRLN